MKNSTELFELIDKSIYAVSHICLQNSVLAIMIKIMFAEQQK